METHVYLCICIYAHIIYVYICMYILCGVRVGIRSGAGVRVWLGRLERGLRFIRVGLRNKGLEATGIRVGMQLEEGVSGIANLVGQFGRGRCWLGGWVGSRPSVRPGGDWKFGRYFWAFWGDGPTPSVRFAPPRMLIMESLDYLQPWGSWKIRMIRIFIFRKSRKSAFS